MANNIDIFDFHRSIMNDFQSYAKSFVDINDEALTREVERRGLQESLWPDPLIQFNPSYQPGSPLDSLVQEGVFHPQMSQILKGYKLHLHQEQALRLGSKGQDFVVTSGTGSGKSLTFLGTIFNEFIRHPGEGIQGIIVYPMNALVNSQSGEIAKFAKNYGQDFPISYAQYTGQEGQKDRDKIRETKPNLLLTNYMMLELLLTRRGDDDLKRAIFQNLKFLAFDEMHTFRGRQGADVALLIRRLKAECRHRVVCMGTSATMAGGVTALDRKSVIAKVASQFFGSTFGQDQIIEESLQALSGDLEPVEGSELAKSVTSRSFANTTPATVVGDPLFVWVEKNLALKWEEGRYRRATARSLEEMARALYEACGVGTETGRAALVTLFQHITTLNKQIESENTQSLGRKPFLLPFKIHQFLSQSGAIRLSLHGGEERIVDFDDLPFGERGGKSYPLFPVVFSRASGTPFLCLKRNATEGSWEPRDFNETTPDDQGSSPWQDGYLVTDHNCWNPEEEIEALPGEYVQVKAGKTQLTKEYALKFPQEVSFDECGHVGPVGTYSRKGWFLPVGFPYDPTSGELYHHQTSEFTKLTRLGLEGRSTATSVLTLGILQSMKRLGFGGSDTKVMSFTD